MEKRIPNHLKANTKTWMRKILQEFEFEDWQIRLLVAAGEAWDEAQAAREAIAEHGMVFTDRFGQSRPRPEIGIQHNAVLRFRLLMRELNLSEPPPDDRPPGIAGRYK